jgi:hypothetical protein
MHNKIYGLNENVKERFSKKASKYNEDKNLNLPIAEGNIAKLICLSYNKALLAREIENLKNGEVDKLDDFKDMINLDQETTESENDTIDHKLCSRINKEQLDRFIHSLLNSPKNIVKNKLHMIYHM